MTGNNMFAYCGNNPVAREDEGGEAWNIVIGAVVGAVIGGTVAAFTSYKQNGKIDWTSVAINAVVGGVCGAVAATGMNMFVQAGISAFASGTGNLLDQAQSKGWDDINGWDVAVSTALGFGTALLGTGAGKIIGGKWAKEASRYNCFEFLSILFVQLWLKKQKNRQPGREWHSRRVNYGGSCVGTHLPVSALSCQMRF